MSSLDVVWRTPGGGRSDDQMSRCLEGAGLKADQEGADLKGNIGMS